MVLALAPAAPVVGQVVLESAPGLLPGSVSESVLESVLESVPAVAARAQGLGGVPRLAGLAWWGLRYEIPKSERRNPSDPWLVARKVRGVSI